KYNLKMVFIRPISPTSEINSTANVIVKAVPIKKSTKRFVSDKSARKIKIPDHNASGREIIPEYTPSKIKNTSKAIKPANTNSITKTYFFNPLNLETGVEAIHSLVSHTSQAVMIKRNKPHCVKYEPSGVRDASQYCTEL